MAIPPGGTFDYVATVPEHSGDGEFECQARLSRPVSRTGDPLLDSRLVGWTPTIRVVDDGLTVDAGPRRPWVLRSRIILSAGSQGRATLKTFSFHVDKTITSSMRAGDELHLSRTSCGGLGLSVVRHDKLVVAAGAIASVPLGSEVQAIWPGELIARAEAVFREADPEFTLLESPIEIRVRGVRALLTSGRRGFDEYAVFVMHGFQWGVPGVDAYGSICDVGACPEVAATASAMLMATPRMESD